MLEDIAIKVENLTKIYKLYDSPKDRVKEALHPLRRQYHKDFYALNNVSFEIKKGEKVGVIGRNGSGKSTLLKLITGVITPTSGTVSVKGKVSALLELGTGFNPELSGMENVYFNGTLMGYTREEMDAKIDDILAFADIGEFIHQAVKTYSSGMYMRLAFALATNVDPDILIVDEALEVGDSAFKIKCLNHMQGMIDKGISLVIVSHNSYLIERVCNTAIFLDSGNLLSYSNPRDILNEYDKMYGFNSLENDIQKLSNFLIFKNFIVKHNNEIINYRNNCYTIKNGCFFEIAINYEIFQNVSNGIQVGIIIKTSDGHRVFGVTTNYMNHILSGEVGDYILSFNFNPNILLDGNYIVGFSAFDTDYVYQLGMWDPALNLRVSTDGYSGLTSVGSVILPHSFTVEKLTG